MKPLIAEPVTNYIYAKILRGLDHFRSQAGSQETPTLATILVGDDPASHIYVGKKGKMCEKLGFGHRDVKFPTNVSEAALVQAVLKLNKDPLVDGILIQKPLPNHIDEKRVLDLIDPLKDVDCFSPYNVGLLTQGRGGLLPCTPAGVMELLNYYEINPEGKNALIIGRSEIVGKPLALLLLKANATVTIAHSKTQHLDKLVSNADLIVAAIGKPHFLNANFTYKKSAVVIDVGINRNIHKKIVGDADYEALSTKVGMMTPVPGGVGPMTIAMLMVNTLKAAYIRKKIALPPGF